MEILYHLGRWRGIEHLTDPPDQLGSRKWFRYTPKTAAGIFTSRHKEDPETRFLLE